ncbi:MAG: hypothetical protein JXA54_12960 [Candidatus Heimdallarchaeota archaeon]|nr:hypothetical protein [Candidatus Heimdallarchaeota archaeon]
MVYYLTDNTSSCQSDIIKQLREHPSKEIVNFLELIELEEEDRKLKKKIEDAINETSINIGEVEPIEDIDDTLENPKEKTTKENKSRSINKILFNESHTNFACMICKLKFKKDEMILQCKLC